MLYSDMASMSMQLFLNVEYKHGFHVKILISFHLDDGSWWSSGARRVKFGMEVIINSLHIYRYI
jgi:hypothetical protein